MSAPTVQGRSFRRRSAGSSDPPPEYEPLHRSDDGTDRASNYSLINGGQTPYFCTLYLQSALVAPAGSVTRT
ncbi:MAG: hypothetical protein ISS49_14955 [Anaerolineae bacterium]|nr:hypothetical protein [Anaerolineae bacterium]